MGETSGVIPVQPLSSLLSPRGREAGGGGEEEGVCVDLPSLPLERHLLVDPPLAKETEMLSMVGADAPFISCLN